MVEETTITTEIPTTDTTVHPNSYPLPWAYAEFETFTGAEINKNYKIERFMLHGNDIKPWSHMSKPGELFNIIVVMPNNDVDMKIPLVVMIHDGPHETFSGKFDMKANTFLEMGMAVLMINYRGSVGMGDASLESIISNIGSVICLHFSKNDSCLLTFFEVTADCWHF